MNEIAKHHKGGFPTPHEALKQSLLTLFAEAGKNKLRFELHEYLHERGQALIHWMKEHLRANPIPSDEKIAIVFHSQMIKAMTASGLAPDDKGLLTL